MENLKQRVRVELVQRHLTQRDLAEKLGIPPTTLSTWLCGAATPRIGLDDLTRKIERALRLKRGTLTPTA